VTGFSEAHCSDPWNE